jgi:phosphoribosylformylglycinamidine (FGAM) synthase-like amidotransferase family enzyme
MTEKRKYQVSKDVVQIKKKDGNGYVCMAADRSVRTFQRWRLFPVESMEGYKMHPSFGGKNGIIEAVVGRKGKKYRVLWVMPNGENVTTVETETNILGQNNGRKLLDKFLNKK